MGYIVEYRDESQHEEVMEKMRKAKKAVCEAWDALSEAEEGGMQQRSYGGYRGGGRGMYREYDEDEQMNMRRSRDSRGRYM